MIKADAKYKYDDYADGRQRYPWDTMKVGESFEAVKSGAHSYAYNASIRYAPKAFRARITEDGYRIFRVK